jgi:RNA polymerase sigma factor for flagellar operon FliA
MYMNVQQEASADELVTRHAPLVKRVAYHLKGRLPDSVQVDDLIQSGMLGLLEAAKNFDSTQGASFETYAGIRIRGSMLDEIRLGDWTPRSVHRKAREMNQAIKKIEDRKLGNASDSEIAKEMGVSLEEFNQILRNASVSKIFSIDDGEVEHDYNGNMSTKVQPETIYKREELAFALERIIDDLPERERLVMSFYYEEQMNLREIGEVLGVSESRVSQIHGKALITIRSRVQNSFDNIK